VFRAGAAVAPVTDWRLYDSIYTERYLKLPAENPDGYRDSSPVNQAERLSGALLLIHGTGDDNVHWGNTLAFVDRLYRAGKPYDLQVYPNLRHGIEAKKARIQLYQRIADHFLLRLGP
jgi:dipeptidyl-peptidase-4